MERLLLDLSYSNVNCVFQSFNGKTTTDILGALAGQTSAFLTGHGASTGHICLEMSLVKSDLETSASNQGFVLHPNEGYNAFILEFETSTGVAHYGLYLTLSAARSRVGVYGNWMMMFLGCCNGAAVSNAVFNPGSHYAAVCTDGAQFLSNMKSDFDVVISRMMCDPVRNEYYDTASLSVTGLTYLTYVGTENLSVNPCVSCACADMSMPGYSYTDNGLIISCDGDCYRDGTVVISDVNGSVLESYEFTKENLSLFIPKGRYDSFDVHFDFNGGYRYSMPRVNDEDFVRRSELNLTRNVARFEAPPDIYYNDKRPSPKYLVVGTSSAMITPVEDQLRQEGQTFATAICRTPSSIRWAYSTVYNDPLFHIGPGELTLIISGAIGDLPGCIEAEQLDQSTPDCFGTCMSDMILTDVDGDNIPDGPVTRIPAGTSTEVATVTGTAMSHNDGTSVSISNNVFILCDDHALSYLDQAQEASSVFRVLGSYPQCFFSSNHTPCDGSLIESFDAGVTELFGVGRTSSASNWMDVIAYPCVSGWYNEITTNQTYIAEMFSCSTISHYINGVYEYGFNYAMTDASIHAKPASIIGYYNAGETSHQRAMAKLFLEERAAIIPGVTTTADVAYRAVRRFLEEYSFIPDGVALGLGVLGSRVVYPDLESTPASSYFVDDSSNAFPQPTYSVESFAVGDINTDGWEDIYFTVVDENATSQVFQNDGDGTYSVADASIAIQCASPFTPTWLDIDNDGNLDLHVVDGGDDVMTEWTGSQFTTYSMIPGTSSGTWGVWMDIEPDGDLDLYMNNYGNSNVMYYNDGAGNFIHDAAAAPGKGAGRSRRPGAVDFDLDGDVDLYLPSVDDGDILYENIGNHRFVDVHEALIGESLGSSVASWGDWDNNGSPDLGIVENGVFRLFRNDMSSGLTEISPFVHKITLAGAIRDIMWGDFNNDGYLDIAVATAYDRDSTVFNGYGNGGFEIHSGLGDAVIQGLAAIDYDRDGYLDILTAPADVRVLHNVGEGHHWLQLDLVGQASNRTAIGARVVLEAGGITQSRYVGAGDGHVNQGSRVVAFGLGDSEQIEYLQIWWPNGYFQLATNLVAADGRYVITEPGHTVSAMIDDGTQQVPCEGNVLFGCPAGDGDELVVTLDFDDSLISAPISATNIDSLVRTPHPCYHPALFGSTPQCLAS